MGLCFGKLRHVPTIETSDASDPNERLGLELESDHNVQKTKKMSIPLF